MIATKNTATQRDTGPLPGTVSGWSPIGNIKGPSGSTGIPDPLHINQLYVGVDARFTGQANGLLLEVRGTDGVWHTQANWVEGTSPVTPT